MKLFKFQSDQQFVRLGHAVDSLLSGEGGNLDELIQGMPEMVRPMLAKIQDRLRAEEAAAQIERQRFKTLIEQLGKDDAQWRTDCPEALLAPVESLAEKIKVLRTRDAALNLVDSKIMIADNNRVLNYCNQSANRLLEESKSELTKRLGNFRLEEMMGGSIDR
ncbi:MAG: hypothetical protein ACK4FF_09315 [Limnobacter sp.]|uniref:hypothetical protein n=1 Tax=Limnobacter sp. TaxID=2003368 RepID=UPI00391CC8B6